jgi:hypothetical protein
MGYNYQNVPFLIICMHLYKEVCDLSLAVEMEIEAEKPGTYII